MRERERGKTGLEGICGFVDGVEAEKVWYSR